jgi:hypothetical protein
MDINLFGELKHDGKAILHASRQIESAQFHEKKTYDEISIGRRPYFKYPIPPLFFS